MGAGPADDETPGELYDTPADAPPRRKRASSANGERNGLEGND